MRKKYFNQMEDMKGKIRVYARVRPMLPFEAERGQQARAPARSPRLDAKANANAYEGQDPHLRELHAALPGRARAAGARPSRSPAQI